MVLSSYMLERDDVRNYLLADVFAIVGTPIERASEITAVDNDNAHGRRSCTILSESWAQKWHL